MKRSFVVVLVTMAAIAFSFWLTACDQIKETVNENASETENIDIDLTPSWVPLVAITAGGQEYSAICYTEPTNIDTVIATTDYADMWEAVRDHLDEMNIKEFSYEISDNNATSSGEMLLYVVEGDIPTGIASYPGLPLVFVNPSDLSSSDLVASVPIQAGTNVSDWTEVNWEDDGESRLEELLVDYEQTFRYCLDLNITPVSAGSLSSIEPTLKVKLHLNADVVFVPLS